MLAALVIGIFAAVWVGAGAHLSELAAGRQAPLWILLASFLATASQRFVIEKRPTGRTYEGLSDLLGQIHAPSAAGWSVGWAVRGAVSMLYSVFGGGVGTEGPAVEFAHALSMRLRSRSSRWFEQRRRTDAACALAGGISAAFGAPFAGVLFPMEMGIGGRTLLSATSSLAAYMMVRHVSGLVPSHSFDLAGAVYGFKSSDWKEWAAVLCIALAAAAFGGATTWFIRYMQSNLFQLFRGRAWSRMLAGGIILYILALIYRGGMDSPARLLEGILWGRRPVDQVELLFFVKLLGLSALLSAFGTIGVFWPLFALGGYLGFSINHLVFNDLPGFSATSGLIGAAAFLSAALGTPVAGAVLAFEASGSLKVLLPCFAAAVVARQAVLLFKGKTLVDSGLENKGLRLKDGKSISVLESIHVCDAMVSDHRSVTEQEAVSGLGEALSRSRYPFLPVVTASGTYSGILTLDMVQEAWYTDQTVTSHSSLSQLLEVKDLLYRSGVKVPSVKPDQRLSEVASLLDQFPCLGVVNEEGRVIGLLLIQNLRQAYDREVARRSLELAALSPGV